MHFFMLFLAAAQLLSKPYGSSSFLHRSFTCFVSDPGITGSFFRYINESSFIKLSCNLDSQVTNRTGLSEQVMSWSCSPCRGSDWHDPPVYLYLLIHENSLHPTVIMLQTYTIEAYVVRIRIKWNVYGCYIVQFYELNHSSMWPPLIHILALWQYVYVKVNLYAS